MRIWLKVFTFIAVLFTAFVSGLTTAAENCSDCARGNREVPFYSCSTIRRLPLSVGSECATGSAAIYRLVRFDESGESWRAPDGMIWHDLLPGKFSQAEAIQRCQSLGMRLPTREEYLGADMRGLREVLPHLEHQMYWTSDSSARIGSDHRRHWDDPILGEAYLGASGAFMEAKKSSLGDVRCVSSE